VSRERLPYGTVDVQRLATALQSKEVSSWLQLIFRAGRDIWADGCSLAPGFAGDLAHAVAREYEAGDLPDRALDDVYDRLRRLERRIAAVEPDDDPRSSGKVP
jgi:hypothetical protein